MFARHTFVVQVREPGGMPVVENLRTHERRMLADLTDVGPEIERWLRAPRPVADAAAPAPAEANGGPGADDVLGLPLPAAGPRARAQAERAAGIDLGPTAPEPGAPLPPPGA